MRLPAILSLLALVLQDAETASLPKERKSEEHPEETNAFAVLHTEDYVPSLDGYSEVTDVSSYKEPVDYGDQLAEIKVSSLALPTRTSPNQSIAAPITSSNSTMTRPTISSLLGYQSSHAKLKRIDLSSNSISSLHDDALRLLSALQDLILTENQLAALPVLTSGIEFLDVRLNQLQSSGIQPEAFKVLEKLRFLYLADNLLDSIPGPFPLSLRTLHLQCPLFDPVISVPPASASPAGKTGGCEPSACLKMEPRGAAQLCYSFQNNMIETLERDAFCDIGEHRHTHRQLEDIRLDGNPINLSLFPEAYFCLPWLPMGHFT